MQIEPSDPIDLMKKGGGTADQIMCQHWPIKFSDKDISVTIFSPSHMSRSSFILKRVDCEWKVFGVHHQTHFGIVIGVNPLIAFHLEELWRKVHQT